MYIYIYQCAYIYIYTQIYIYTCMLRHCTDTSFFHVSVYTLDLA